MDHQAVFTMEDMRQHIKFSGAFAKTEFVKNLFFQDKKKKEKIYLICAADSTELDLKAMWKQLGCTPGNMRGGSEELMFEILGAKKGGVSLFSIVNDVDKAVTLVVDQRLWNDFDYVGFHPMVNTATVAISREDMQKVVELSQHEPTIMDFGGASTGATAAPAKS